MAIKKIIYSTKFRELSYNSLFEFLEFKKIGLEEIVLLHVIPREEVAFVPFGGYLKDKALELKESAFLKFQEWEKEIKKESLRVKICVEIGEVVAKILEIIERERADLIIIGKKKTIFPWQGELSSKIIERSKIPVLLYRRLVITEINGERIEKENKQIFKKPLIATDFSEISQRAALYVLNFKELIKQLTLVHVIKSGTFKDLSEEQIAQLEKQKKKKLREEVSFFEKTGITCEDFLRIGEPTEEILDLAREKNNTLIVIGKSGKGLLQKFVLGSVSRDLIHKSEFPLLIVP